MLTLDPTKKQDVKYCIPTWLRDEQVKLASALSIPRIQPYPEGKTRKDKIAIVGFGPSLKDTWKKISKFKYIITTSGAHTFLLERGIIPNWHVAVDPLPKNTVQLIGKPHKKVEYLIASACHPDVFEHLKDYNVKLWHVFSHEEEALRVIPNGDWSLTGGCDVGMRAMTLARFLGFINLHMFGFDGSAKGASHAGEHPATPPSFQNCEYPPKSGIIYKTTPALLECSRQVIHELDELIDVKPYFYGKGLTQAMFKDWKRKPKTRQNIIALVKPILISDEMIKQNAQLHKENLAYGVGAGKHANTITILLKTLVTRDNPFPSVLDYGCGKGYLQKNLSFSIFQYDPAIPEFSSIPKAADLVCCLDVLEHIEPDKINNVLADLARVTKQIGYFVINTGPAKKTYPNGQNTHLIQKGESWWKAKLDKYFEVGKIIVKGNELHVVVGIKNKLVPTTKTQDSTGLTPLIDDVMIL